MAFKKIMIIIFLITALSLSGCRKINQENYDKIKMGMEQKEVIAIIGEASTCDSILGASNCTWGNDSKNINIKFIAEQVVFITSKGL